MRIAITGGKGGTGKSTVATALAVELAKKKKILLIDADVDCPNDHIILSIKRKKEQAIYQSIPKFNHKKCIKCGKCAQVCRANAILSIKEKYPIFVSDLCIGCNACSIICPVGAISRTKKQIGTIYSGKGHDINLVTGEMVIGYEEASPIVNAEKNFASKKEQDYDFIIIDTGAGTHCNVIAALLGCDLALAVTEPTPLGAYDLELILELTKMLKIPAKVILNRSNVGDKNLIKKIVKKYKTKIIAEIPYKKEILEAFSRGKPIEDESINKIANFIEKLK
ncbi:MAG: ATP-binding protein [Candidatus Pacearchaeota archaeon]|nr:MAG: ATP-binding protein [Candidatus Pacearchaeota archaeon]